MIRNKQLVLVFVSLVTGVLQARHFQFGFGFDTGNGAFQFSVGQPAYVQPVYYAPVPAVQYEPCFVTQPVYRPVQGRPQRAQAGVSYGFTTRTSVKKHSKYKQKKQHHRQAINKSQKAPHKLAAQKPAPALKNLKYSSASVLPYTSKSNGRYVLLGQEAFGRDANTWDDFGGSRDLGENHPIITAAREFAEETEFLFMNKKQAQNWLDVGAGNTKVVVAKNKNATYITRFDQHDLAKFTKKFNNRVGRKTEKKALAWVKWEDLERAICSAQRDSTGKLKRVNVWAQVLDRQNKSHGKLITVRPFLVAKLRDYFMHEPYVIGNSPKIRFY